MSGRSDGIRRRVTVLLGAATIVSTVLASPASAAGPGDVSYWCAQGGVKITVAATSFVVPSPPSGSTWTLLVLDSQGRLLPDVFINPVVGASYSDPGGSEITQAILCQVAAAPPTTIEATTTTVDPATTEASTTTTVAEQTTTTAGTPPTTGTQTTTAAPPTAASRPTTTSVSSHAPQPPETTATVTQAVTTTGSAAVVGQSPTVDAAPPGEQPVVGATARATSATPAASGPSAKTTSGGGTAQALPNHGSAATAGVEHSELRAMAAKLPLSHRSKDGLIFVLAFAAVGVGGIIAERKRR
ncbi:MAG TPA: hypothetical protein VH761_04130 [Ilumatobacteraceae bacterium]|jgi:hypothetical protein